MILAAGLFVLAGFGLTAGAVGLSVVGRLAERSPEMARQVDDLGGVAAVNRMFGALVCVGAFLFVCALYVLETSGGGF